MIVQGTKARPTIVYWPACYSSPDCLSSRARKVMIQMRSLEVGEVAVEASSQRGGEIKGQTSSRWRPLDLENQ